MPASQQHISSDTPLGANVTQGGVTFRTWAPQAREVYIALNHPAGTAPAAFAKDPSHLLVKDGKDLWGGFVPGLKHGDLYRFYVVGTGSEGFKRDPYARELEFYGYPDCNCIIRDPSDYKWHDSGFRPPAFNDLIIYQFHIGVFYAKDSAGKDIRPNRVCKILDVVDRIEYFADLGVNAVMPLPFQEFQGENGLGYNGTDLFSPEMDYAVQRADLAPYLARVRARPCVSATNSDRHTAMSATPTYLSFIHITTTRPMKCRTPLSSAAWRSRMHRPRIGGGGRPDHLKRDP